MYLCPLRQWSIDSQIVSLCLMTDVPWFLQWMHLLEMYPCLRLSLNSELESCCCEKNLHHGHLLQPQFEESLPYFPGRKQCKVNPEKLVTLKSKSYNIQYISISPSIMQRIITKRKKMTEFLFILLCCTILTCHWCLKLWWRRWLCHEDFLLPDPQLARWDCRPSSSQSWVLEPPSKFQSHPQCWNLGFHLRQWLSIWSGNWALHPSRRHSPKWTTKNIVMIKYISRYLSNT